MQKITDTKLIQQKINEYKNILPAQYKHNKPETKEIREVLMLKHVENTFILCNNNNTEIGTFTDEDIIKYITLKIENNIQQNIYINIIEKYICTVSYENNKLIDIKFKSHKESPFMGDIEMLISLNDRLKKYESHDNYLMRNNIRYFIYKFNVYILHIISLITEQLKNDLSRKTIRESLIKYSCGLSYRISKYVKSQFDALNNNIDEIKKQMSEIAEQYSSIQNRLDTAKPADIQLIEIQPADIQPAGIQPIVYQVMATDNLIASDKKPDIQSMITSDIIEEIFNTKDKTDMQYAKIAQENSHLNTQSNAYNLINNDIKTTAQDTKQKTGLDITTIFNSENGFESDTENDENCKSNKYVIDGDISE